MPKGVEVQVLSCAQNKNRESRFDFGAGRKLRGSFRERHYFVCKIRSTLVVDLKTFDSFLERRRDKKTEKVYRNCKFQDSSPAHQIVERAKCIPIPWKIYVNKNTI